MEILIIAAHPDDEILGMGGTIKKLSKNNTIHLVVVSEGATGQYTDEKMIKVRQKACKSAGKILGISKFYFFDFPDMRLDTIPHIEVNQKLEKIIKEIKPTVVYTTPYNDYNKDHKIVFESTLIASRPKISSVKKILVYEIPNFTKKPFDPNIYEDIEKEIKDKLKAFKEYKSEVMPFPHPRSLKAVEALSHVRGYESGTKNAEAFKLIHEIVD